MLLTLKNKLETIFMWNSIYTAHKKICFCQGYGSLSRGLVAGKVGIGKVVNI